jgi:hypothetical protein
VELTPWSWRNHRFARIAKIALLVVLGIYAFYLIAMNVFLSTSLFTRVINMDPRAIDVHYASAWSIWPTRVHAKGLSIRSRDGNVEWILRIDRVKFSVSLLALARQRFVASDIVGNGESFRLRGRLDWWAATPERMRGLPAIEGFSSVPVRPYLQCVKADWSEQDYHLWTVQLEDVAANDVRELWIDKQRLEGPTTTTGRFYLKPIRAVEVGPLRTQLKGNRLSSDEVGWVEGLQGTADLTIPRFDPRVTGGKGVLGVTSMNIDVRGTVPDVARLPLNLPDGLRMQGPLEMRRALLHVEGGGLRTGSRVDAAGPSVVFHRGDMELTSALAVAAEVQGADERLVFKVLAGSTRLARGEDTLAVTPRLQVTGDMNRLDVDHGVSGVHVIGESPSIEVPSIQTLSSLFENRSVVIEGGRGRADVRLEGWLDEDRATGRALMQA